MTGILATTRAKDDRPYRLALVIDPHTAYWREVILGIRQYAFESRRVEFAGHWFEHEPRELAKLVSRDHIDGIIAAIHWRRTEQRYCDLGIPVVNVSNTIPWPRIPVVTQDDFAVGRMAAEHLQERGCHRLVFWGQYRGNYSNERLEGFKSVVTGTGATLDVRAVIFPYGRTEFGKVLRWMRSQKPPLGVFVAHDTIALLVLRAARALGWQVPGDLALLGSDDDEFLAALEEIPFSSIRLPTRTIGYTAAVEINRLISGGRAAKKPIRLPPLGVVIRQSTDTSFVQDEAVARAVNYIRQHALANPYIADVVRAAGVSRSLLHARFRAILNCSVLDEIQRVRIEHAKELLRSSKLKLDAIAEQCGFSNYRRFIGLFRQKSGMSPGQFRQSVRGPR